MNEQQRVKQADTTNCDANCDEIRVLLKTLPIEQQEEIVSQALLELPAEYRARAIEKQFGQSGLAVVLGGNCSINTINADICLQIQNSPSIDMPSLLEALVMRSKSERSSRS